MTYEIIATGSHGNATIINDRILIDCGVPFKRLLPYYRRLQIVLLTHCHADHFNSATIRRLALERPALRFGCPAWLVEKLSKLVNPRDIDVLEMGKLHDYAIFRIEPFPLLHNVPNCGYKIEMTGDKLLYATDMNNLDSVTAKGFELYMVEANYTDEEMLERIKQKQESGQHVYEWDVMKNHMSFEKASDWLYQNAGPNSQYIFMHGHKDKKE